MSDVQDIRILILDSVILALREDIGKGDITTNSIIPADHISKAKITVKEPGVVCGLSVAQLVFMSIDKNIRLEMKAKDGDRVKAGTVIAVVHGPTRGILTAERTAVNFLQRLSGISTLTNKYVTSIKGTKARILDTRKTTPGLRSLEKYAVSVGGGLNHRLGLYDAVLIKDNHISAAGGIKKAVELARKANPKMPIEVETKTIQQVKEALDSDVSRIMLDNMSIPAIKSSVKLIRKSGKKMDIEVSGGIKLNNVKSIAKTGVDFISVGSITHSAPAIDIALKVF